MTTPTDTVTARRLTAATVLLTVGESGLVHPRAAAFLLRRALEEQLDRYLRAHRPDLTACKFGTKAAWLAQHLDAQLAGRLAAVWRNLSAACHHHQFALPPSTAELRSWQEDVVHVLRALRT
ncbi:hypothetical protein [Streptacidiphilus monticola]|uniref:Uncharacterized protein n=1 Tax=Streptacidiphilus monticola TaxID=2161674 RepID=A0ABW1G933_9ACTN